MLTIKQQNSKRLHDSLKRNEKIKDFKVSDNRLKSEKIYTSKARDKQRRHWHLFRIEGSTNRKYVQVVMTVKFFLYNNAIHISKGVSPNRIITKSNIELMKMEAFDSALWNSRLSYKSIKSFKVQEVHLQKWSRAAKL